MINNGIAEEFGDLKSKRKMIYMAIIGQMLNEISIVIIISLLLYPEKTSVKELLGAISVVIIANSYLKYKMAMETFKHEKLVNLRTFAEGAWLPVLFNFLLIVIMFAMLAVSVIFHV